MTDLKDLEGQRYAVVLNDGKPRELKYNFQAMREIDDKWGLESLFPENEEKPKVNFSKLSNLQFMLWAGTLWLKEDGLTAERIAELMPADRVGQTKLMMPVYGAFVRDYSGKTDEKKSADRPPEETKS